MSISRTVLFMLFGISFLTCAAQGGGQRPIEAFPAELDSYIRSALTNSNVPGAAVAIVVDGKILVRGFGVRRLGNSDPVNEDTVFDVASLMKSFTAAAIASLVDEGKLAWDDPVRKHVAWIEFPDPYLTANVTIRDLLAHRVGLAPSNALFRLTGLDTTRMLQRVRYMDVSSSLRAEMRYSNVLYTLGGVAGGAACNCQFADLVTTRLLQPLGLTRTSVATNPYLDQNSAHGHDLIAAEHVPLRWRDMDRNTLPAGGLNSSATDMGKWLLFHMGDGTWQGKRLLSEGVMQEIHSPQVIIRTTPAMRRTRNVEFFAAYGLGWNIMDYRGHEMHWHSGNGDGMPVYMAYLPRKRIGVVVLLNTWVAPFLHGALAAHVLDHYLGVESRDSAAEVLEQTRSATKRAAAEKAAAEKRRLVGTRPSLPFSEYAGDYENPLYGPIRVTVESGKLLWRIAEGQTAELAHWHLETFLVRWKDPVFREAYPTFVTFEIDEQGRAAGLRSVLLRDDFEARRKPDPTSR